MEELLADIAAFITEHGMSESAFGREAVGDHKFVFDLRAGRSPSLRTVDKVRAFMREYTPERAAA